jgi:two-component system cell cycle response regulator DivK
MIWRKAGHRTGELNLKLSGTNILIYFIQRHLFAYIMNLLAHQHKINCYTSIVEYQFVAVSSSDSDSSDSHALMDKKVFDWHDKTILIAEDEEFNFLYLREILVPTKANILRAIDGEMAVQICQNLSVDLVLMDIKMPRMNGIEAIRNIRNFNMQLPVIAQTAYAMIEDSEKCIGAGCNDYLTKPISSKVLLSLINHYLGK